MRSEEYMLELTYMIYYLIIAIHIRFEIIYIL